MARRRYYKPYRRSYPKKKWATCMKTGSITSTSSSGIGHAEDVLVSNSTQSASPTPVIVKTGNFKVQGDCYLSANSQIPSGTTITVYIMYLPEVVVAQANPVTTIQDHPEWIMSWKVLDFTVGSATSNSTAFTFTTRLKRNLNSGDTIALVSVTRNTGSVAVSTLVNYTAQYWTCSN